MNGRAPRSGSKATEFAFVDLDLDAGISISITLIYSRSLFSLQLEYQTSVRLPCRRLLNSQIRMSKGTNKLTQGLKLSDLMGQDHQQPRRGTHTALFCLPKVPLQRNHRKFQARERHVRTEVEHSPLGRIHEMGKWQRCVFVTTKTKSP